MATIAGEPYEERSLFVRKATGLVRGWSVQDAFIYAFFSINLITLGLYIFADAPFIPKGSLLLAIILSGAYLVFQTIVVAIWIALNALAIGYQWDPYPFILLNLFLSMLAAIQAPTWCRSQPLLIEKSAGH